jgi:hypothetical protein
VPTPNKFLPKIIVEPKFTNTAHPTTVATVDPTSEPVIIKKAALLNSKDNLRFSFPIFLLTDSSILFKSF